MRVVSFNANGLRSAARKGFYEWFALQQADVLCVQELKAHEAQLADDAFHVRGFHRVVRCAQRPGYSGVAIYSRMPPDEVVPEIGEPEFDAEGRYVEARFGSVAVVSAYFPSGSAGPARQEAKFRFLAAFDRRLAALTECNLPFIFCGDFNMAHRQIDLKNWRANQNYPGFTPPERAWLDSLFDGRGFVDAFRHVNKDADQYTWWSNRGRAFANNTGWRIDYQVTSPASVLVPVRASIYKEQRFSDHAPLIIDYEPRGPAAEVVRVTAAVDARRAAGEALAS